MWPLCVLNPHFCRACTGASSAADFYPTVKAALRHESADSEEDREGLGCHLGQGPSERDWKFVSEWHKKMDWNVAFKGPFGMKDLIDTSGSHDPLR